MNCHHIKKSNDKVTAARPGGDNTGAVCVYTNSDLYNTEVFTRGDFQAIKNRDIFTLIQYIKDISFPQAMKFVCKLFNLDYYYEKEDNTPKFLEWLDFVETGEMKEDENKITPLPESVLDQFFMMPNKKWLNENISVKAQKFWECGVDIDSERIIFPVRNEIGDICGIKGRLIADEKIDGNKYLALYPYPKSRICYGLFQNEEDIKKANEIIILESEKSVQKLWGYNYKNCIAVGGKVISDTQAELILRCNVDIVLALDKDVQPQEIMENIKKLTYPIKTQRIFVIEDPLNFMQDKKESPPDNMDTWKALYENFKKEVII